MNQNGSLDKLDKSCQIDKSLLEKSFDFRCLEHKNYSHINLKYQLQQKVQLDKYFSLPRCNKVMMNQNMQFPDIQNSIQKKNNR